ncbi:TetR/AcrR family transcriptional regulator [Clostridium sp. MB40-C1]|uniref:TetR/AcrR family transcriptional regulator n=1 Tax=Clostridium sp. MB40-C1 TaxID=3070996 RepID=UPI0027DFCB94|nr:TetR/AcrR family transcriptional regulator [Clostridium sp. MB40-C1]WMJ80643.1 TetR/AcrR family transcriptional regulator [Clostridium sp. MB40-C1]
MTIRFNKVSEEKQGNIINSAINEFGDKGFDNASTDIIAENAGIAKGSLFHYFGSKKNLFLFIVEYCVDLLTNKILNEAENIQSEDFYERIKDISLIKQKIIIKYFMHSKIIMEAFVNMPPKIKVDLEKLYLKYYSDSMNFIEDYIVKYMDVKLLKPSVTKEDAIFVTMTLFDALSKKYTSSYKDKTDELLTNNEDLFKEFDKYIDIIKYGLYQK